MRSPDGKRRATSGQALVEAAIIIPILVILVSGVFDLGRYLVLAADTQAACDDLCRYIEANTGPEEALPPSAALEERLGATYPTMAFTLTVDSKGSAPEQVMPHYYNPATGKNEAIGDYRSVFSDKYSVTLTHEDGWVTPIAMVLTGDGKFTVERTGTAVVDRTLETW